ncbi:flippase-like domain-containing protein [bacterium]|nr:flippase-like domain-containing protein [bacterium]
MNKKTKNTINTIFFLGLGIALFVWTMEKVGFSKILSDIKEAKIEYILIAMACGVISHLARALRWNLLLEPMGYKARLGGTFHAVILGYLVNMVLPRVGEVTRPAALSKLEGIPFNKLVGTVVVERVVDMIITLALGLAIVLIQFQLISEVIDDLFAGQSMNKLWLYGGIAIAGIAMFILFYIFRFKIYELPVFQKLKGFIEGMLEGLRSIFQLKRKFLFIFYSLLIWFMYFCMPYFVLFALPGTEHLGVGAGLTVLLFGTFAMIIPVPGGVGTFEVLVPIALALYGVGELVGNTYAFLTHAIQILVVLSVGLYSIAYFAYHAQKRKKNELARDTEG